MSWEQRVQWGRKNYARNQAHTLNWRLKKFISMTANLAALAELIEEEEQEQLLTPKQIRQWREMFEEFENSD